MTRSHLTAKSTRTSRRGILSLELVLVLPILLVLVLGLFEFSLLFYARGDVIEASRVGARFASLPGVTLEQVQSEAQATLPPPLRSRAQIGAELGEHSGDDVVVAVSVPMTAAAPDLLWLIGYSIRGRDLVAETRMVKE